MASNKDKITAKDIFDGGIQGAYKEFIELNKLAKESVQNLKREIIKMNSAMRKTGGNATQRKKVADATRKEAIATKKLTAETKKLTSAKKKLNIARKQGLKGMNAFSGGIKSLLGAAGIIGLANQLRKLAISYYNNAKALDSMNLAMRSVTADAYELGRAKEFLSKTSDRLGLNLLKTSKRYATFLAAAKQSNLTMKETNEIFEVFANIGANLGLMQDEMASIFLALEQMLSKGKVSTEELRRQLGEKLPGAMGIMADALGVTTGELDKMLRKGLVLSEDAMPKFAKQAKKVFSIDLNKRVVTLAAAQERLTNAWLDIVESTASGEGGVGSALIKVLELMTAIVEETEVWLEILGSSGPGSPLNVLQNAWKGFAEGVSKTFEIIQQISDFNTNPFTWKGKALDRAVERSKAEEQGKNGWLEQYKQNSADIRQAIRARNELQRRVAASEKLGFVTKDLNDLFGREIIVMETTAQLHEMTVEQIDEEIDKRQKLILEINEQERKEEEAAKKREEQMKKWRALSKVVPPDPITKLVTQREMAIKQMLGDMETMVDKIAKLREKLRLWPDDETAKKELDHLLKRYKEYAVEMARIQQGGAIGFTPITIDQKPKAPIFSPDRKGFFVGNDNDTKYNKDDDLTDTQKHAENAKRVIEATQKTLDYVNDIENNLHEKRMMRIEEETDAINKKYDDLAYLAQGDADLQAKLAIRRREELEKNEKDLKKARYEAAKAKKRQALIDATLNMALAVTAALTALPPISWAAVATAGILGTAAIAAIASSPLPAYAEGTENHPGGLAMLGDGGKNEIALSPDGGVYMSGNKPEVVDLPKGSKVMADAKDYINEQVIKAIIATDNKMDEIIVDKISEAVHKGFKSVKISNNNVNNNNIDFQLWRDTLLN